jgi:sarcosine oxidase subunit beta
MPFGLLKYGFSRRYPAERQFPCTAELKPSYDVVIIGGGGHGLATAYYLARDYGITSVAVIEKGYLASRAKASRRRFSTSPRRASA